MKLLNGVLALALLAGVTASFTASANDEQNAVMVGDATDDGMVDDEGLDTSAGKDLNLSEGQSDSHYWGGYYGYPYRSWYGLGYGLGYGYGYGYGYGWPSYRRWWW